MFHKKLTSKRSITIPKELALEASMDGGTPVDIEVVGGKVVVCKHVPQCRFCGDKLSAVGYKGIEICPNCAAELGKAVAG